MSSIAQVIKLEPLEDQVDLEYPLVATVPLPQGWTTTPDKLQLQENNVAIVSTVEVIWSWPDGSPRWLHVTANFRWDNGTPRQYTLINTASLVQPEPSSDLVVGISADQIIINNGVAEIVINRLFDGIHINDDETLGGISLTDDLAILYDARFDTNATMEAESVGPAYVTILLKGWVQTESKSVRPFIKYTTRITIYNKSSVVKIDHACTFADDMQKRGVQTLAFTLPENYIVSGRFIDEKIPNVLVNNVLYQWPGIYESEEPRDVEINEVYKFKYLTQGPILQNALPNSYRQALDMQEDTTECKPEYVAASNLEGVSMRNEMSLLLNNGNAAEIQKMYLNEQIPSPTQQEMCDSEAWDLLASVGQDYVDQERTVNASQTGFYHSILRYSDYGWHIFGNTHSIELMSEQRPSLHRVWFNAHYFHISTLWTQWLRSKNKDILHWARAATDNYDSIGLCRYDTMDGYVDGNFNRVNDGTRSNRAHRPGDMYHTKGLLPWGGRDYGMDTNDMDAWSIGHWPDPHSMLLSWLIDADRWAKDGYDLWYSQVSFSATGAAREANTTLVNAIKAYEYKPKSTIRDDIERMVNDLIAVPVINQFPGGLWEPTWIRRAVHFFPNRTDIKEYAVQAANDTELNWEGIWNLDLSACAYEITNNPMYLTRHGGSLIRNGKNRLFQDPTGLWKNYGFGANVDQRWSHQWGRFLKVVRASGEEMPTIVDAGNYPVSSCRANNLPDIEHRGTKIKINKLSDEEVNLNLDLASFGGDIHSLGVAIYAPNGDLLSYSENIEPNSGTRVTRPSSWIVKRSTINFEGPIGVYTVGFGTYEAQLYQKINANNFPEAMVLQNIVVTGWGEEIKYKFMHCYSYLLALTNESIVFKFKAMGDRYGSYVSLRTNGSQYEKWLQYGEEYSVNISGDAILYVGGDHSAKIEMQLISSEGTEDLYLLGDQQGRLASFLP